MHLVCPLHPSPFALSPNCLPILSFSISLINQQITAMTAAHCFAPGKQFKMNFNRPGLGIHFILCMSALYNGSFGILNKLIVDQSMMPKKSRAIRSSHWACGPDKSLHTIPQALAMHAFQLPWLGRVSSGRWRGRTWGTRCESRSGWTELIWWFFRV